MITTLNNVERLELEAHRAHVWMHARLGNLKQRLSILEAPRPTAQERQQAEQQTRIDRFWQLTEEKMDSDANLSAQEARRLVLAANLELRTIYPMLRS